MGILVLAIAVGMTAAVAALLGGYSVWVALALYSGCGVISVLLSIGVVATASPVRPGHAPTEPRQADAI